MATLYGKELILDLVGCNSKVTDPSELLMFIKGLLEIIDMKAFGDPFLEHFGHNDENTSGYSFIQPIETSSLIAHISEKNRSMHLNIFSCKEFNVFEATSFATGFFGAEVKSQLLVERVY